MSTRSGFSTAAAAPPPPNGGGGGDRRGSTASNAGATATTAHRGSTFSAYSYNSSRSFSSSTTSSNRPGNNNGNNNSVTYNRIRLDFGTTPPFCGRQQELQELMEAYEKVVRSKRAASVLVQGSAGCGKSRLIETFRDELIARTTLLTTTKRGQSSPFPQPSVATRAAAGRMASGGLLDDDDDDDSSNSSSNSAEQQTTSTSSLPQVATATMMTTLPAKRVQSAPIQKPQHAIPQSAMAQYPPPPPVEQQQPSSSSEQPKQKQQQKTPPLPPIFVGAKFEEGQAASSEALGPVLECFAALSEELLSTPKSRDYWAPHLQRELQKDLLVLISLLPEALQDLEPPPPIPPPVHLSGNNGSSHTSQQQRRSHTTDGSGSMTPSSNNNNNNNKKPSLLSRARTMGAAQNSTSTSNNPFHNVFAKSQPSTSMGRLPTMASARKRISKSQPSERMITMNNQKNGTSNNNQKNNNNNTTTLTAEPPPPPPRKQPIQRSQTTSGSPTRTTTPPLEEVRSRSLQDAPSRQLNNGSKAEESSPPKSILTSSPHNASPHQPLPPPPPSIQEALTEEEEEEDDTTTNHDDDDIVSPLVPLTSQVRRVQTLDSPASAGNNKSLREASPKPRSKSMPGSSLSLMDSPSKQEKKAFQLSASRSPSRQQQLPLQPPLQNGDRTTTTATTTTTTATTVDEHSNDATSMPSALLPPSTPDEAIPPPPPPPPRIPPPMKMQPSTSVGASSSFTTGQNDGPALGRPTVVARAHTTGNAGSAATAASAAANIGKEQQQKRYRSAFLQQLQPHRPKPMNTMQDMSMRTGLLRGTSVAGNLGVVQSSRTMRQQQQQQRRISNNSKHHHHHNRHLNGASSMDDEILEHHGSHHDQTKTTSGTLTLEQEDYSVERAHFALREYLRVVCKERTVIFFLDDIQWAGREAVGLFRALLSDTTPTSRPFLFLLSHRPLPRQHEMIKLLYDLEQQAAMTNNTTAAAAAMERNTNTTAIHAPPTPIRKPHQINIDNLYEQDVVQLVSKLLRREEDDVKALASLVHRKTGGNSFFCLEYIRLLEDKALIHYSIVNTRWEWGDLNDISARTEISDNVVDVVASKICQAPHDIKLALLTAAAFGAARFSVHILFRAIPGADDMRETLVRRASTEIQLQQVVKSIASLESLICTLEEACDENYLEAVGPYQYKFAHDRIREATTSLLPRGIDMPVLRLRIGRQLRHWLRELQQEGLQDEKLLLQVVVQLNQAAHLMKEEEEKVDLSELNFAAADNAIQRSSFFPASDFLRTGVELLGDHPWEDHYEHMIRLSDALMRMDYCCGRLVVSVELANEILQHATNFDDKKMAYHIKVLWLTQNERMDEALDLILSVLEELGAPVPRRHLWFHKFFEWFRTERLMRAFSDQQLLSLPDATAEHIDDIGSFMERLEEVALSGTNPRPDLLSVALLRVMQLTLRHGRFSMTPTCLVSWGWYNARRGKLDVAHRFGKLGVQLASEQNGGYHDARAILMFYAQIYHWRKPYHDGIRPSTEALQKLWDLGAIEYVFLDTITYLRIYFCCGLRLEPLAQDIRKYVDLLKDYGHRLAFENHVAFFQCVAKLMGRTEDTADSQMQGEFDNFMQDWEERNNDTALQQAYFQRMMLAYFFNDIELALDMSSKMWSPFEEGPDVFLPFRVFFMGMTALTHYNRSRKYAYRRQGKKMLSILEKWDRAGVVNVRHMVVLLKAECNVGSRMDFEKTRRSFDDAIAKAGRRGFLHFQALANERAGVYCRDQGEHNWGQIYIVQSRTLYIEWGAFAKARQMNQNYGEYLEHSKIDQHRGSTIHSRPRLHELSRDLYKGLRTDDSEIMPSSSIVRSSLSSSTKSRSSKRY